MKSSNGSFIYNFKTYFRQKQPCFEDFYSIVFFDTPYSNRLFQLLWISFYHFVIILVNMFPFFTVLKEKNMTDYHKTKYLTSFQTFFNRNFKCVNRVSPIMANLSFQNLLIFNFNLHLLL